MANLACVGAAPIAVVNCLNFGNPEHPEVMWQLSEAIDGLAEACTAFGLAVIGGNVSLYNESGGADIDPTPVLGTLGLVEVLSHRPPGVGWEPDATIVLLGERRNVEDLGSNPFPLGGTRWALECRDRRGGSLPGLDTRAHLNLVSWVQGFVAGALSGDRSLVCGIHDVSGGGLGVALAEMACAANLGCHVEGIDGHAELFCEVPGRIVAATLEPTALLAEADAAGVPAVVLGRTGGDRFVIDQFVDMGIDELVAARRGHLEDRLGAASA